MRRETHWGLAAFSRPEVPFCIVVTRAEILVSFSIFLVWFLPSHEFFSFVFISGWPAL